MLCLFRVLAVLAVVTCSAVGIAQEVDRFDKSGVILELDSPDKDRAKVILIAGAPSNKPGQHEYFAGCALMMDWLKKTPGVWPVMLNEWPNNEQVLQGARTIVYFGDGGGKQPFVHPDRWTRFVNLMESGTGLVLLHQAVDFPEGTEAKAVKDWMGGVWLKDIGCRGHWDMDLASPGREHPVLRGVSPFSAPADGWLYNLHFSPNAVPLLTGKVPAKSRTTEDAKKYADRDEVIAWAFERPNGARGFAFTGADLHKSWSYDSQRKLVLNGILWTSRLEVPANGVDSEFRPADLERNLDRKETVAAAKKK